MFLIIQIMLFDTDQNCVVLAVGHAVVLSRTNLLLVADTTRPFKSNSSTPTNIAVTFSFETNYFNFHLTHNASIAFPG